VARKKSQFYLETATAAESAASQWRNHSPLRTPFLASGKSKRSNLCFYPTFNIYNLTFTHSSSLQILKLCYKYSKRWRRRSISPRWT